MENDTQRLRDILEKTVQPYRLGAEISAVTIGDSQYLLRHDMPAEDELDESFEKINCGIMGVAINRVQAEMHKEEFTRIVTENFLQSGWIDNGVSAKQFAAYSGEKFMVGASMVAALGAHYGIWRIVAPGDVFDPGVLKELSKGILMGKGAKKQLSQEELHTALTLEHGFYFVDVKG